MRFLKPSDEVLERRQRMDESTTLITMPRRNLSDLSLDDEEYYVQELLLARYARKLLRQRQIRTFVKFGAIADHELRVWLSRERTRDAFLNEKELGTALSLLHEQFNLDFPTKLQPDLTSDVPLELPEDDAKQSSQQSSQLPIQSQIRISQLSPKKRPSSKGNASVGMSPLRKLSLVGHGVSSASFNAATSSTNSMSHNEELSGGDVFGSVMEKSEMLARIDLAYLLQEMMAVECLEWTLVIATVLMRTSVIITVLRDHPELWSAYGSMMNLQTCEGYKQLSSFVISTLGFAG